MDQVFRSLRRLAVAGGILLAIVAPPAQALACGMGLDFRQTIHDSPIVVIAQSQGRAQGKEVLTVNRVLKGRPLPFIRVTSAEFPVPVRPGNRFAIAIMHAEYDDGNGVSAWLIHSDGSLSAMGKSGEPRTVSAFVNYFMAPTSSTDAASIGGGSIPGGVPTGLPIIAAGLLGGCLVWRRAELRTSRTANR